MAHLDWTILKYPAIVTATNAMIVTVLTVSMWVALILAMQATMKN